MGTHAGFVPEQQSGTPRRSGRRLTRTSLNRLPFRRQAPMEQDQWATTACAAGSACRPHQPTTKQPKRSPQQKQLARYCCDSFPEGYAPLAAVSVASQSCFPPPSSPHVCVAVLTNIFPPAGAWPRAQAQLLIPCSGEAAACCTFIRSRLLSTWCLSQPVLGDRSYLFKELGASAPIYLLIPCLKHHMASCQVWARCSVSYP